MLPDSSRETVFLQFPVLLQLQSNFTQNPEAYSQLQDAFTQNPDFSQLKGGLTQGDFYTQQVHQHRRLASMMLESRRGQ